MLVIIYVCRLRGSTNRLFSKVDSLLRANLSNLFINILLMHIRFIQDTVLDPG